MSNKWINLSLKTWLGVVGKSSLLEEILRWCSYDLDFIPSKLDISYKRWPKQGQGSVKCFEVLKRQHGLHHHINKKCLRMTC